MSAKPVSPDAKNFFAALRTLGIILGVAPHRLNLKGGVIVVTCGDGDHFFDVIWHLLTVYLQSHLPWACRLPLKIGFFLPFIIWWFLSPRTHMLVLNGGACLLSPCWPKHETFDIGRALEEQVRVATDLKDIWQVILYAHAPCGAAGSMLPKEQVAHLMEAKMRIKGLDPRYKVACFMHLCFDDAASTWRRIRQVLGLKRRTYFVSREAWENRRCELP